MSLPPEKASELKQIIHNHLTRMDIHGKIRDVLAETVRQEFGTGHRPLSEEDFMRALQHRGIVDEVMRDLHFSQELPATEAGPSPATHKPATHFVHKEATQLKKTNIDPTRRCLYLQVLGGKAFLEHLQEPEPLPGQVCSTFTLYLNFRNQRFRSKPVPCACEPDLHEGFLLEVHKDSLGDGSRMADATTMLSISDPVHMVLIKTDPSSETTLVSSYFLDWRSVLSAPNGKTSMAVELLGVGSECKVPVGVLNVKLELYPPLTQTLTPDVIATQVSNMVLLHVLSAIPGAEENSGERASLPGLRQAVVEGVPGDSPFPPNQAGQDLCTGRERREPARVLVRARAAGGAAPGRPPAGGPLRQPAGDGAGPRGGGRGQTGAVVHSPGVPLQEQGRLRGPRHAAVQPAAGLRTGRLRVRGHQSQGHAPRLGHDPGHRRLRHLLGEPDGTQVPPPSHRPGRPPSGPPAQALAPVQDGGLRLQPRGLPGQLPAVGRGGAVRVRPPRRRALESHEPGGGALRLRPRLHRLPAPPAAPLRLPAGPRRRQQPAGAGAAPPAHRAQEGPGRGHGVGRPPVLPAVGGAGGLRAGALHRGLLRQRGVPGRREEGGARRAHLQGLPHPLHPQERPEGLRHQPQVSVLRRNRVLPRGPRQAGGPRPGVRVPRVGLRRLDHVRLQVPPGAVTLLENSAHRPLEAPSSPFYCVYISVQSIDCFFLRLLLLFYTVFIHHYL